MTTTPIPDLPRYFSGSKGTMFCPQCGHRNDEHATACLSCGSALAPLEPPDVVWAAAAPGYVPPPPPPDPAYSPPTAPYDQTQDFDDAPTAAYTMPAAAYTMPTQDQATQAQPTMPAGGPPTMLTPTAPPGLYLPPPRRSASWVRPLLIVLSLGLVAGGIAFIAAANRDGDNNNGVDTTIPRTTAPRTTAPRPSSSTPGSTAPGSTTPGSTAPGSTTPTTPDTTPVTTPVPTEPPTVPTTPDPTEPDPTTTVLSPQEVALEQLATWLDDDRETVETLVGKWVPQVGAKRVGTKDDGITYKATNIVDNHQGFRDELGAILLASKEYVFKDPRLWVSIIPEGFATSGGALQWCIDNDLPKADCFAKLITHDESIQVTTAYR